MQGSSAAISGRIVAEAGVTLETPLGLRVKAFPPGGVSAKPWLIIASIADDWSFRMSGLSGLVEFAVATDGPPFLVVTRISVDGIEVSGDSTVPLDGGTHKIALFVATRETLGPAIDRSLSSEALVQRFVAAATPWEQFLIGKELVNRRDKRALSSLLPFLKHEDRHRRGNAAFVYAGLGDPRGFPVITDILNDQSERPPGVIPGGNWTLRAQIRSDRYYAAHLLGDLRDANAVPVLIPLLEDKEVKSIVPWALGEIGDRRAIRPLLAVLDDDDPSMRVLAISALETLHAKEALPRLVSLSDDQRKSNFGLQISVAEAAKRAIAALSR